MTTGISAPPIGTSLQPKVAQGIAGCCVCSKSAAGFLLKVVTSAEIPVRQPLFGYAYAKTKACWSNPFSTDRLLTSFCGDFPDAAT